MSEPSVYTWPKPYLLQLYQQAVDEGCIRIVLQGESEAEREAEWKSFRAAFYRMRRRRDAGYIVQMHPEYAMVQLRFEPEIGRVLIAHSSLPDSQTLPKVESVDGKRELPQPLGAVPKPTPEEDPADFDATKFVSGMIDGLKIEDEDDGSSTEL